MQNILYKNNGNVYCENNTLLTKIIVSEKLTKIDLKSNFVVCGKKDKDIKNKGLIAILQFITFLQF